MSSVDVIEVGQLLIEEETPRLVVVTTHLRGLTAGWASRETWG